MLLISLATLARAGPTAYPFMELKLLPQDNGAACLDGTPPAYWIVPGTGDDRSKFIFNFEGGGWCTSLDDCASRAGARKGSSNHLPNPFNLASLIPAWGNWYLSDDPAINPTMANWTKVMVLYCDGASWSGSADPVSHKGKTLHFRGKENLDALLTALLHAEGLDTATEVVINGGSAGGLAVYLHADYIASKLPAAAKVAALPDAGFFMDNDFSRESGWVAAQQWVYANQNCSAGVPHGCLARYPAAEQWKCFFAQYVAPLIKTPTFALNGIHDSYQIGAELKSTDPIAVNAYGANLSATVVAALLSTLGNGAFLDGCEHHGGDWAGLLAGGVEAWTAFDGWYHGTAGKQQLWKNSSAFPCKACCHCSTAAGCATGCKHLENATVGAPPPVTEVSEMSAARPQAPLPYAFGINLPCMNGSSGTGAFEPGVYNYSYSAATIAAARKLGFTAIRIMINIETAGHPATLAAQRTLVEGIGGYAIVCMFGTGSTVTHGTGRIDSIPAAIAAWSQVHAVFGAMPGVMYEVLNEPHGYGAGCNVAPCGTDQGYLKDMRAVIAGAGLPEDRVILDALGWAQGPQQLVQLGWEGNIGYHFYPWWLPENATGVDFENLFTETLSGISDRIYVTEFGGTLNVANPGYSQPSTDNNVNCFQGMQSAVAALHRRGVGIRGAMHWHGWHNGDTFDFWEPTNKNGQEKVLEILSAAAGLD